MYLSEFLDTLSLSRAEKLYYEKTFKSYKDQKSSDEWKELLKLNNTKQ